MDFQLTMYEIFRNGNWELFCASKNLEVNEHTWDNKDSKIYSLSTEEIVLFGLVEYVKEVMETRNQEIESVFLEYAEENQLNMDHYDFFPTIKNYRNTYGTQIYDFVEDWHFYDLEQGIIDDIDDQKGTKRLRDHIMKNRNKILLSILILCPYGCPLGKKITYSELIEIADKEQSRKYWTQNCSPEIQKTCISKDGTYCKSIDNFLRRMCIDLHWLH